MMKQRNFPETEVDIFEVSKGKSETIPGRALHICEIMLRSLRGAILSEVQNNKLDYGEDEGFEDAFDHEVDLTDLDETMQQRSYLEQRIQQASKQKKKTEVDKTEIIEVKETEVEQNLS